MTARRAIEALVAAALGGGALLVGLTPGDAVVVAVAVGVLTIAVRSLDEGAQPPWPEPEPAPRDGARPAVSVLMWSFAGRDGKVSEAALRHLRRQATRRLAARGIGPDDGDAVRATLGDRAWAALAARGGPPTMADVAHCVEVVDALTPNRPERRP